MADKRAYHLKRTERVPVYEGAILRMMKDRVELPDGRVEDWDFIHHKKGGGASVVPVLPDGRILLIRQFRPAIGRETLELPAGARDPEDPDLSVTALRELEEETGYTCEYLEPLLTLDTAVAWCDETTDLYVARDIHPVGAQQLDEAEEIDIGFYTLLEVQEMIFEGIIRDAKTVAGVMGYLAKCSGGLAFPDCS